MTSASSVWRDAFRAAFPPTLPILAAYWLIGAGYGLFAMRQGMPWWFPTFTAAFIYSGSVEFILVSMAADPFRPVSVFLMAFLVGARHLFYGIAMLDRFRGAGWRKIPMVGLMADETFAITWGARVPDGVDRHSFQTAAALLLWGYWITGTLFGTALSSCLHFFLSTNGQASAVGTIVSAGYGFVCGAYMPISSFGSGLRRVLGFLPGTYGTALLKNHLLGGVFDEMENVGFPEEAVNGIREAIDCRLFFYGHEVKTPAMFAILAGAVLFFTGLFVLFHVLFKSEKTK